MNEKWLKVLENEELMMKVVPMLPEEAQKVLAENGYDFTLDEILEMGKELYKIHSKMNSDGELSDDDLEDVSGGSGWRWGGNPGPFPRYTINIGRLAASVW